MLENNKLLEKVGRKTTGLNRNSEIRMQGCLTDSNSSTYKSTKLRNHAIKLFFFCRLILWIQF